jgi:glycerophosphoryl diester phosphodiesterase
LGKQEQKATVKIIGHRGAKQEAPENTLLSFNHLKSLGIQSVEFDLRLSADNEIVIIHDDTLERTTNSEGLVRDKTAAELKALDASSYFSDDASKALSKRWAVDGVPTLKEVLKVFDKLEHAQLEVKPSEKADHEQICQKILECVNELGVQDKCVITSSDYDFLESCKIYAPNMKRGFVYLDIKYQPIETALALSCDLLAIYWKFCSQELIDQAHNKGLKISAWTVNEQEAFTNLKNWGIDSIITDYPSELMHLVD